MLDPILGKARTPQSWNRYAYVIGNPLRFVDPDGRSIWVKLIKVIRQAPDGTRKAIATYRNLSKQKAVERTKNALDKIDDRQRNQGYKRVVQVETTGERGKVAAQLSSNKKARPVEKSGGKDNPRYPRHQNPEEGEYKDVHVESSDNLMSVGAAFATVSEIFAPASSAVSESEEATPGELLSAAAWDITSTLDPTGVTDAISWYFDIE